MEYSYEKADHITFEVEGGLWSGSLSTNNVVVFVTHEELM